MRFILYLSVVIVAALIPMVSSAWDCSDPALDCDTIIVRTRPTEDPSLMGLKRPTLSNDSIEIQTRPQGVDPASYLQALAADDRLRYAEPAFKTTLALSESAPLIPSDEFFGEQQHWEGTSGDLLAINEAWATLTESQVVVAVIDSGIDYTHPDLAANIWTNIGEIPGNNLDDDHNGYIDDVHGYNFHDDNADPMDVHLHGTHMAGIIGAVGNNFIGVTGLLWRTQIMPLRFTDNEGIGDTAKAIEAIHYAVANGARVINMSWTIMGEGLISQGLFDVIHAYAQEGVLFVTASGNGGLNFQGFDIDVFPVYPASFKLANLITVGAFDSLGEMAPFSNYGKGSVHLLAPGANILSTVPEGQYGRLSGTSAATAFVSASAAMALTLKAELNVLDLKNLLLQSVNLNSNLADYTSTGGTLNVARPLQTIESGQAITGPAPSSPSSPSPKGNPDENPGSAWAGNEGFSSASGCGLVRFQQRQSLAKPQGSLTRDF